MCAWAKYAEFHLEKAVDFISGLKFWNHTNSESSQNCNSIAVLHNSIASVEAENFKKQQCVLVHPVCNVYELLHYDYLLELILE